MRNCFSASILILTLLPLASCSKDRETSEAKPQNHEQPSRDPATASKTSQDTDSVYRASCASCHGVDGEGDGPMGRSLRVANLSSPAWQQRVTDEEIAKVITEGRGGMPAFELPPDKVKALVQKVRSFRK